MLIDVTHIDPCFEYRLREEGESPGEYGRRAADLLEAEIQRLGPDSVMAFMAEPVVGATMAAVAAAPGYFKRIREICDTYGVLLILDEVVCGMGRTGTLFACEQDGIAPDIVCIAKGLGAGYQPIGAMLCSSRIYQTIAEGSGFFQHGHTYLGHPVACAAGRAVVSAVLNRGLLSRVQAQGVKLTAALHERFGQNPHVGDIRGRDLFQALEFVTDRETKTPFNPSVGVNKIVKRAAFEADLICYPMGAPLTVARAIMSWWRRPSSSRTSRSPSWSTNWKWRSRRRLAHSGHWLHLHLAPIGFRLLLNTHSIHPDRCVLP